MPRNDAAAQGHVCPGICIHAIAIVQLPGIGISPIAEMDPRQTIVNPRAGGEEQRRDAEEDSLGSSLAKHAS